MLSLYNIKSAAAASHYYENDDYYAKDSPEHKEHSEWYGKGAEKLNLQGNVEKDDFKSVLEGKLPNGVELGRKENDKLIHAPGLDATFSAPKSVSIQAEVFGDSRIYDAHKKAVTKVLSHIQKSCVYTRKTVNSEMIYEKADNVAVAMFRHNTSRNHDPQLHTHCVIANAVQRSDGKWRSAYLGEIYDKKMLLGQMYRIELAYELKSLGYEIRMMGANSKFEIESIPDTMIEMFSSRSKEIKEAAEAFGVTGAKGKARVTLTTRQNKKELSREILQQRWQEIVQEHDKKYGKNTEAAASNNLAAKQDQSFLEYSIRNAKGFLERKLPEFRNKFLDTLEHISYVCKTKLGDRRSPAEKGLDYAINHLMERSFVWDEDDMRKIAMHYVTGEATSEQLNEALLTYYKKDKLLHAKVSNADTTPISSKHKAKSQIYITTKQALVHEAETINLMKDGIGKVAKICSKANVARVLEENQSTLNQGQQKAIELMMTTKDRIVGIQGYAGTGKTHMLKYANMVVNSSGYKIVGMAPSNSAVKTLEKDTDIKSQTLQRFLFKYDGVIHGRGTQEGLEKMRAEFADKVLIIDEVSLASTTQINGLLKIASNLQTRVVLIGDHKQLGAVEAGKPFYQLRQADMKVAYMPEIQRQKDQALKGAVCSAIQGKIETSMQYLNANVIEVVQAQKQDKDQSKGSKEQGKGQDKAQGEDEVAKVSDKSLAQKAIEIWSALPKEEREKTLITAPMHKIRSTINNGIREVLQKEGELTGKEKTFVILDNLNPTRAQAASLKFYKGGMIVLFNNDYKSRGINKGEYLKVNKVNLKTGIVVLERDDGTKLSWRPEKIAGHRSGVIDVFERQEISLQVGDCMYWTRTDKQDQDIINSGGFKIKSIDSDSVTVALESGVEKVIANTNPILKHIDYAYTVTVHVAQGKTYDRVIGVIQDYHLYLTNQKLFYVTISRARHQGIIITGDKAKLIEKLLENTGERMAATEHQGIKYSWIRTAGSSDLSAKVQAVSNNGIISAPMLPVFDKRLVSVKGDTTVSRVSVNLSTNQQIEIQSRQIEVPIKLEVISRPETIALPMGSKILESIEIYAMNEFGTKHKDRLGKVISGLDATNKKLVKHIKLGYIESHEELSKALTAKGHSEQEIKLALKVLSNIGNTHNIVLPCHNDTGYILGFVGINEKDLTRKPELSKNLDPTKFLFNADNIHSPDDKKYWKPSVGKQLILVDSPLDCLHIRAYSQISGSYESLNNIIAVDRNNFTAAHAEAIGNKKIESIVLCLNDNNIIASKAQICKVLSETAPGISIKLAKLTNNNPADSIAINGIEDFKTRVQQAPAFTAGEIEIMKNWLKIQEQKDSGVKADIFSPSIFNSIKANANTKSASQVVEKHTITKAISTTRSFAKTPGYNIKEIYRHLYNKIPTLLPEFGFVQKGSFYISTTDVKVDGSGGKKGKVYIYANNPGIICDYTRENVSIWDYVKNNYMPSAGNAEIMKYLVEAAGLNSASSWEAKNRAKPIATMKTTEAPKNNVDSKLLADIYSFAKRNLVIHKNKVMEYLKNDRKYSSNVIKKMGLGFISSHDTLARYLKKCGWSDSKVGEAKKMLGFIGKSHKLVIPYQDNDGKLVGFAARNIFYKDTDKIGKYMYTKGLNKSHILFNIHNNKEKELVIVEGMFDALNAQANGLSNFVTLGGVGFNENMAKLMQSKGIESIVLYLDQDEAGKKATVRIKDVMAKVAPEIKIKEVSSFHGIKDPDQLIQNKGVNAMKELITNAKTTVAITVNNATNPKQAFIFKEGNANLKTMKTNIIDIEMGA